MQFHELQHFYINANIKQHNFAGVSTSRFLALGYTFYVTTSYNNLPTKLSLWKRNSGLQCITNTDV